MSDLTTLLAQDEGLLRKIASSAGIKLDDILQVEEITENSNLNSLARIVAVGETVYVKQAPETSLPLDITAPASRNQYEAEALRIAQTINGPIASPVCLYVDHEHNLFVMSSVFNGSHTMADLADRDFIALTSNVLALAQWLCTFHSRLNGFSRPESQTRLFRNILFQTIYAQGAKIVFPDSWGAMIEACMLHSGELVHSDFWAKNFLVSQNKQIGIVDFEGAMMGDGALDIASLLCTALFCAGSTVEKLHEWHEFGRLFANNYRKTHTSSDGTPAILNRISRHMPLLMAHRTHGVFPYRISDAMRQSIAKTAVALAGHPDLDYYDTIQLLVNLLEPEYARAEVGADERDSCEKNLI